MTSPDVKACTKCQAVKPLGDFYRSRDTKDGRAYHCKACMNERVKQWSSQNPDARAQHRKRWRDENLELAKQIEKRSYLENREQRLEYKRQWSAANKPRYCHYAMKRKVAQGRATPPWADPDAIVAVYRQCAEVSQQTGVKHHVDHIIPLQGRTVCGLHVANNLQILTADANKRKANKF